LQLSRLFVQDGWRAKPSYRSGVYTSWQQVQVATILFPSAACVLATGRLRCHTNQQGVRASSRYRLANNVMSNERAFYLSTSVVILNTEQEKHKSRDVSAAMDGVVQSMLLGRMRNRR
jgi:hypothetical protein